MRPRRCPASAASAPAPVAGTTVVNASTYLTLTFTPQRSDVTYTVEVSSDLAVWSALTLPALAVGQPATVTDSTALSAGARRFLRLEVTLP